MREHGARLFARNLPYSAWSVTHDGADDNERQSRIEYSKRDKQVRKKDGTEVVERLIEKRDRWLTISR